MKLILGDCLEVLKTLPSESVDCVMTSPPYWALRDYGTASWEGGNPNCDHKKYPPAFSEKAMAKSTIGAYANTGHAQEGYKDKCGKCGAIRKDKQLGLEPTFQEYITKLCDIFDEVKRVLKKEGTCWVNLGDTYGSPKCDIHNFPGRYSTTHKEHLTKTKGVEGYDKCLLQIPSRFAIEMCNRGWILRNEIIWHKPNCMPSSVKDRFTVDFEKVFFFVKNKKYYFETQYEPHSRLWDEKNGGNLSSGVHKKEGKIVDQERKTSLPNPQGRNKRCVWRITTKPYKEAHFATFPPELVETPIRAGCPKGGVVLDPFCGSGTTGAVATELGRDFIGIELNPEYIKLAEKRLLNTQKDMF